MCITKTVGVQNVTINKGYGLLLVSNTSYGILGCYLVYGNTGLQAIKTDDKLTVTHQSEYVTTIVSTPSDAELTVVFVGAI